MGFPFFVYFKRDKQKTKQKHFLQIKKTKGCFVAFILSLILNKS
jgi:hypothetical protein